MYKVAANPIRLGIALVAVRGTARKFHISSCLNAASIFKMPAMSPTMTEGGIVSWKVKAGDEYSAGDVLLEVETDKATIDVEAQDDGIMWEILEQEGASGIPVGKSIAYLAEPGDDLASLEKPQEEPEKPKEQPKKETKEKETKAKTATSSESKASSSSKPAESSASKKQGGLFKTAAPDQKLFPSVELLLHENGISIEDALEKIPASGPKGRILKGDVLAYLGKISTSSVETVASFISLREHLDLSNIKLAEPETPKQVKKEDAVASKPNNVLSFNAVYELGEDFTKTEFKLDFEQALLQAKQLAYAERYPEFAISPTPSLAVEADNFFNDIISPPVTKSRFEVKNLRFDFGDAKSTIVNSGDLFDEIIGSEHQPSTVNSLVSEPVEKVNVLFDVKFDEALVDSELFVDSFEETLLTILPPKEIVVA